MMSGGRYKLLAVVMTAVSMAIIVIMFFAGFLTDSKIDRIICEVEYPGSFNVTIKENGRESVFIGFGKVQRVLVRPADGQWVISLNAIKTDSSAGILTAEIKLMDGNFKGNEKSKKIVNQLEAIRKSIGC